jgi:hypothetical protein
MLRHPRPASAVPIRRRLAGLLGLGLSAAIAGTALGAAPFPDRIELPVGWQPEGITSRGTTAWVGSLANGAIWEASLRTGEGRVLVPGEAGQMAVGIDYEAANDRLWVAGGATGSIRVYDASSGELLAEYDVQAGFLNDVIVTEDAAYVTDSAIAQLIVIPLGDDGSLPADAVSLPLTGDIVYDPAAFNANGITAARGWLLIVQSNTGRIFRVDPDTGVATELEGGYDATFGDGIEIRGNTIWVVRNQLNEVLVLKVDGRLTEATEVGTISQADADAALAVPTTITIAAGSIWAVNARFGTPPAGAAYWVTRLPVKPAS